MDTNQKFLSSKPKEGEPWDVVIIGSGPAAFTAAIYTTRGAASTLIIGGDKWGGQLMLTSEVDNFPGSPGILGPDLMQKMKDHSTLFGGEFVSENVNLLESDQKPFRIKTSAGNEYLARSVILATGAQTRWLGISGEKNLIGKGISSCAPCDAPFFKDKKVAVIGGGDSAMEEALVLTKYAQKVTIIHRRNEFRASKAMQEKVFEEEKKQKIGIIWDAVVKEFLGEQKLEKLVLQDVNTKKESFLEVDGAFVAVGHTPSSEIFKGKIELDEKGYIKRVPNENYQTSTSVDGVFTAGDIHDFRYKQAITAAGFGCQAGMDILRYLDSQK